jgi:hypothetical protein
LLITTVEQAPSDSLLRAELPGEPRQVEPGDPGFIVRLDLRVEAPDIATPVTQSLELTRTQQTEVTVELLVPVGLQRRIRVTAFNEDGMAIFRGETTVDLTRDVVVVEIVLGRGDLLPEATTPSTLANKAFTFDNGAAFGIAGTVTLTFGTFEGNTGSFVLASPGGSASGSVTIAPSTASTAQSRGEVLSQARQDTSNTRCDFTVTTSTYPSGQGPQGNDQIPIAPCETDSVDGRLIAVNARTGARSTSAPPTESPNRAPNGVIDTPANKVTIIQGQTVRFTGSGTDPDGPLPLSFLWTFAGGAPNSTLEDPGDVTFNTVGTFTVIFTVTDAAGLSDPTPDTRTITVTPMPVVNLDITVRDVTMNQLLSGSTVTINGVSHTTDTKGAAVFADIPVGASAITVAHTDYLTHAFVRTIHTNTTGLNLFIYPLTEATVDTDRDGLPDDVETNTGIFLSALNTGTDANNPDTDGDGLNDGVEILVEEVQ